jgi:opacity protein-like surface antigen
MKKLLFVTLITLASSLIANDLLVVRGGREIHGRVLEENQTHVTFYTDYGKKIQIHKSRISVIVRNGEVLTVNPPVGNIVGIKVESDISPEQSNSTRVPSNTSETMSNEPVTYAPNQKSRNIASGVVSEHISEEPWNIKAGVILGLTQSKASGEKNTTNRSGAEGGVVAEIPFLGALHLQSELLLSQAGYQDGDTVFKYNYVKIPVLLKYRHSLNDRFSVIGMAGPSLGFRTDAKSELAGVSTDMKSTTKSTIAGWDMGLGAEYTLSSKISLFANARYSMQLNNLDTTIGATTATKLRQLSFLTGFLFSI